MPISIKASTAKGHIKSGKHLQHHNIECAQRVLLAETTAIREGTIHCGTHMLKHTPDQSRCWEILLKTLHLLKNNIFAVPAEPNNHKTHTNLNKDERPVFS